MNSTFIFGTLLSLSTLHAGVTNTWTVLQAKANVLMQHQQEHVKQEKENFVLCANPFIVNVHSTFRKYAAHHIYASS